MTRRAATLKDVAQLVGVHPSTVSRALSPETRDLVADAVVADAVVEKIARAANWITSPIPPPSACAPKSR